MSSIGQAVARIDALGKVTGKTAFPGDLDRPDQAHMKILFAGRPHARIRRLDTAAAEAMPGVLAVFTARDVPVNEYGLIMPDQPVLCGPGSAKPYTDRVRFVGDQVAVVVAETELLAAEAAKRIQVEFEDLPVVTDPLQAMLEQAPQLHPDRGSNVFCHYQIRKGDPDRGFARADVVVEGEYRTPAQEHAYLQPEAGLGYIDEEGRVTVETAGQWTHEDQEQIAHALGLPRDQIRVNLSGHRRRLWRPGRHVGADRAGVGGLAAAPARDLPSGQDHLEPGGVHPRPPQAASLHPARQVGGDPGGQADGRPGGGHPGRRRLRLHLHQGAGQRHPDVHRARTRSRT